MYVHSCTYNPGSRDLGNASRAGQPFLDNYLYNFQIISIVINKWIGTIIL